MLSVACHEQTWLVVVDCTDIRCHHDAMVIYKVKGAHSLGLLYWTVLTYIVIMTPW